MSGPEFDRIKGIVLRINPNLTDDELDVVVPAVALRESFVQEMASSPGCTSPEWNEASRKVLQCELIMAQYGLME